MSGIKASKGARPVITVFLVVGVLLLAGAIALGIFFAVENSSRVQVDAAITQIVPRYDSDGDRVYDVYVDFTYNGQTYEHVELNYWNSDMNEGDVVTIYIDGDDPTSMGTPKVVQIIIPCALAFFGAVFTFIGGWNIGKENKKYKGESAAKAKGTPVPCTVMSVIPDTTYVVNGRIVNNLLECVPQDKSLMATFVSRPFSAHNIVRLFSRITVYVDPDNPENYFVDLSSLTPPTPEEQLEIEKTFQPAGQVDIPSEGSGNTQDN